MIEIKVTVEMPGIPEALTRLADALAMTRHQSAEETAEVVPISRKRKAKDKADDLKPVEAKPEELTPPTPKEQVVDTTVYAVPQVNPTTAPVTDVARAGVQQPVTTATTTATEPKEATPARSYTLEEISKAGLALMDDGRLDDLMGLLAKHGLQSLTAADPKQYNDIAADLIAMGGVI